MGDTGFVRFPGCLDPRAREFRPITQITLFHPQFYYPYPPPIPELQLTPFSDFTSTGAPYPNYNTPPAHVSPPSHRATPPLPSSLPPPSAAPTRTLLLSSVPTDVSESEVRRDLEIFGDVRAVQMERVREGILTVHFYDVRNAQAAAAEIRRQHMQQQSRLRIHYEAVLALNSGSDFSNSNPVAPMPAPAPGLLGGHAVWAQFKLPATAGVPDGINQGTIVIFNLDSEVSTARLKEIFEAFGAVKELRETPLKRHQRFVEFYDVRDAARALSQMNGKEINDKPIVIEFSRPGGHIKRFPKSTQTITVKTFSPPPSYSGRNPRCFPFPPPSPPRISGSSTPNLPPRCYNSQSQLNSKKSSGSKGNGKGDINQSEECSSNSNSRGGKKNSKKGQTNAIGGGGNQQQQLESRKGSSKAFSKGRQGKNYLDPRFLINEERVSELDCRDSRTTVMIKNIPNKYSQKLLLNMLDNHCIHCNEQIADGGPLSSYDFVYLPIDFINKCNVGYGFVNMTSPQATLRLYKAFHQHNWEVFNSKKICEVTYARLQGVEALMEHFKNSKFPGEADDYLPVIFSPPRDGRQLTDPTPIVGRSNGVNLQSPTAVSCNSSEEPNDDVRVVEEDEEEVNGNNEYGGDNDVVGGGRSGCSSTSKGGDNGHESYEQ